MTGPAKFVWIITTWMALMVLPHEASAAAPKDAVKNMPTITHTSTFRVESSEKSGSHDYKDTYTDYWLISWGTGKLKLTGGAWGSLDLTYKTTWTDILKRLDGSSSDTRYEDLKANLKYNDARGLTANFELDQQDNYSGSTPSTSDRNWTSKTIKRVNMTWDRDRFPKISLGHVLTTDNRYSGLVQSYGTDNSSTQLYGEHKWEARNYWQFASLRHTYSRSDNYGNLYDDKHTGTSKDTYEFIGKRSMTFPNLGKLSLGVTHTENSSASLTASSYGTSYSTSCYANLEGGVRAMPLTYGYKYSTLQTGSSGSPGNLRVQREFSMQMKPPVPVGKSGSVTYLHKIDENTYTSTDTTTEQQNLSWTLNTNPRTQTIFTYGLKQVTNRRSQERTDDAETLQAQLKYSIPGGRGSINGKIWEQINRKPNTDKRITADYFQISSNMKLSPKTNLILLYNQRSDETRNTSLAVPSGKDEYYSQITYNTKEGDLGVKAIYTQKHRKNIITENKTDIETLELVFNYKAADRWSYTLSLSANTQSTDSGAASGYDYQTGETITATVTCAF